MSEINLKLKTYDELTFEISRLNTDKYLLEQKLQQKENIIKEVREYIENNKEYTTIKKATKRWQNGKVIFEESDEDILTEDMIKEVLEILDKENI